MADSKDGEGKVFVKYTAFPGLVTRILTKQWFKDRGHDVDGDVVFNSANRNMVDASEWPAEIVEELKDDGDFQVSTSPTAPKQITNERYDSETHYNVPDGGSLPSGSEATGSDGTTGATDARSTAGTGTSTRGSRASR
jgi:hypothetical protein